jgi:hypothetical protein
MFKKILRDEGATLLSDTRFAIRGSAVTGNGFDQTAQAYTKDYFDIGRKSDLDIAIVSRSFEDKTQRYTGYHFDTTLATLDMGE